MSTTIDGSRSGKERQNRQIEDLGQELYTLSNEISNESDEMKEMALIRSYWTKYDYYQELVRKMAHKYGENPNNFPYWDNPHVAVLDAQK